MNFETYQEIVDYLNTLPDHIAGLRGVTVGADEEIFEAQNTRIKYPHLWVETPEVRFTGSDTNPEIQFRFSMVVVTNENKRTQAEANAALSRTLKLMEKIWAKLLNDADGDEFDLVVADSDALPVRQWSSDNCYGWRIEPVTFVLPRLECLHGAWLLPDGGAWLSPDGVAWGAPV